MKFMAVKETLKGFKPGDTIEILYYGAYPYIFNFKDVSYKFSYGSLVINDLTQNEEKTISIASIKAINRIKSEIKGLNDFSAIAFGGNIKEV